MTPFKESNFESLFREFASVILFISETLFDDFPSSSIKIFKWKIQGLFIKRQVEVSKGYANLISDNIMTMDNVFKQMFNGAGADKLLKIITKHAQEGIDKAAGFNSSIIKLTSGYREKSRISEFY